MKSLFFALALVFLFMFLAACGNDAAVVEEPVQAAAIQDTTQ